MANIDCILTVMDNKREFAEDQWRYFCSDIQKLVPELNLRIETQNLPYHNAKIKAIYYISRKDSLHPGMCMIFEYDERLNLAAYTYLEVARDAWKDMKKEPKMTIFYPAINLEI